MTSGIKGTHSGGDRGKWSCEFKAILVYTESPKIARAHQRETVSKKGVGREEEDGRQDKHGELMELNFKSMLWVCWEIRGPAGSSSSQL